MRRQVCRHRARAARRPTVITLTTIIITQKKKREKKEMKRRYMCDGITNQCFFSTPSRQADDYFERFCSFRRGASCHTKGCMHSNRAGEIINKGEKKKKGEIFKYYKLPGTLLRVHYHEYILPMVSYS